MNGLINVLKEKGMTSHDVVDNLRKILDIKKIGHGGTLDPEVEGVLVIGIGTGTRVLEYITNSDKAYKGELAFGYTSDTEDMTGILTKKPYDEELLNLKEIDLLFERLSGQKIMQTPPMYSSVKIEGRKLYKYAREGKVVKRQPRSIFIETIRRISDFYELETGIKMAFYAKVSKGTYIRTLCVTIGELIGIPTIMRSLKRVSVGTFKIENAFNLIDIKKKIENNDTSFLLSLKTGIKNEMLFYELSKAEAKKLYYGQTIKNKGNFQDKQQIACFYDGNLFSICEIKENSIKVLKNLFGVKDEIF